MAWETASIPFKGGLDLSENLQVLAEQPNKAIKLVNFEPADNGGYRRINGYEKFSASAVPGTGPIQGIMVYKGVIAARSGKLYHSVDGAAWTEIPGVTLHATNDVEGVTFDKTATDKVLIVCDKLNKPYYVNYDGSTFTVTQPTEDVTGAYRPVIIGERLAFGKGTKLITSNRFEVEKFDNGFEGDLLMSIEGLKAFRERLIVFGKSGIKQAIGIDDHTKTVIKDITARVGCVDGNTIQEIGGDLIFLAPDGLRTIAATERIDDLEMSVLNHVVLPITAEWVRHQNQYHFTSVIIRESSQYRLYAYNRRYPDRDLHFGLIASLAYLPEGAAWQYSRTRGIPAYQVVSDILDYEEVSYFGDHEGFVHKHNVGNSFDGKDIVAKFYTPYFSLGDISLRKTVHAVNPFIVSEGKSAPIRLTLRYNYNDKYTHQPTAIEMEPFIKPALYSQAEYAKDVYGAAPEGARRVNVEGSGHTVQIRFMSTGGDPYVVQGFNIDFSFGGKI